MSYIDQGYNEFLSYNPVDLTQPIQITSKNTDAVVADGALGLDQTSINKILPGQAIKSKNFKTGSTGWQIDGEGNVEFGSGYFRGDITGASGTFSGTITATTGSIGGWTISATAIYKDGLTDNISSGMASADYPFYAGKKYGDRATAPFRVTSAGGLTATSANISGSITMTSGSISWASVTGPSYSDVTGIKPPSDATKGATWGIDITSQPTDNAIMNSYIANGSYSGGTFISGTTVYSPTIASTAGYISGTFKVGSTGIVMDGSSGVIRSSTYTGQGGDGWQIDKNGTAVFNNVYVEGTVNATAGTFSGSISIGSGNAIFKADSNGIYLGNATYASAPFRVNMSGEVIAQKITVTTSSSVWQGAQIAETYIGNLSASKITSGTIYVGGGSQPAAIYLAQGTISDSAKLRWSGGSRLWEDSSNRLGINSIGSPMYVYVDSVQRFAIPSSGQTTINGGISTDSNINITSGDLRINSGYLAINSTIQSERCYINGDGKFIGNLSCNNIDPRAGNSYNCGGASLYWAYVNCHSVTYHSLGFYDDGVTLRNGRKVSDVEAIKQMKPHPILKTKDGAPLLDKFSLPMETFVEAKTHEGELYKRDKKTNYPIIDGELRHDADGEDGAQLLALCLGAIRELDKKIEDINLIIKKQIV